MTSSQTEGRVLALLRNRYEGEGYSFIEHPDKSELPDFMQGYRPDALALGKDRSIAIEVKVRRAEAADAKLREITERFKAQKQWEFRVVYGDELPQESFGTPTPAQIEVHLREAEALLAADHPRAALVLGWAAIEAIARTLSPDFPTSGPRTMRQAVELLEHLGRLSFDQAQQLRKLLHLRSRVVHGDLEASVSVLEVEPVLGAARAALRAD